MPRPRSPLPKPETSDRLIQRLAPLGVMTALILGSVVWLQMRRAGNQPKKPAAKPQIQLETKSEKAPSKKKRPEVPVPAAALAKVSDKTLLDDKSEPAHDKLRAHVNSLTLEKVEKTAQAVRGLTEKLPGMRGKLVMVRGKLVGKIQSIETPNQPSGVLMIERGELRTASGESVMFETVTDNFHGVTKGEQVILRGACYKLANVTDAKGRARIVPYLIGKQIELDYGAYVPRVSDGRTLRDKYYYGVLMRKVRFARPDQVAADTAATPSEAQLNELGVRDKLRGKFVTVNGTLTGKVRRVELPYNRSFITDIWVGEIKTANHGTWSFDCLNKPAYMAFLQAYPVKLTGAFAKRYTWPDGRKTWHVITRQLDLADDLKFKPMPSLLAEVTEDGRETRDISYFYLLQRLAATPEAEIGGLVKEDFQVRDIVGKADRDKMRGRYVKVSGRLLKMEKFDLPAERRLNPSGITSIYRCFLVTSVATSGLTIYTVDVIEKPPIGVGKEGTIQGAFWKVYAYETRKKGQTEKSPYLLARRMTVRPPPTSPAHDQFMMLIILLIGLLLVFLFFVGRSEVRQAGEFREQLRKRRVARGAETDGRTAEQAGTPEQPAEAVGPEAAEAAPAGDAEGASEQGEGAAGEGASDTPGTA